MFLFIILAEEGVGSFSSFHFEFPTDDRSYLIGQGTNVMVLPTNMWCVLQLHTKKQRNDHQFSLWTQMNHCEWSLDQDTIYYLLPHKPLHNQQAMVMLQVAG